MKICQSCQIKKPLDEFHNRTKSKDGKQSRCKICNLNQRKAYYKTAHGRNRNDLTGRRYTLVVRKKIFDFLLDNPCVDCGESDPVVLEFDHRETANKIGDISTLARTYSWGRIKEEIDKCDVRCSNCHKRKTAVQLGWAKANWSK